MSDIRWRTSVEYVDIDTGENLTEEEAKHAYVIVNKKTQKHVIKTTGYIKITKECRRSRQGKLGNW